MRGNHPLSQRFCRGGTDQQRRIYVAIERMGTTVALAVDETLGVRRFLRSAP